MKIGSLAGGELYFIGEVDPLTGQSTPYTKIGIVRDQRESDTRADEHQTGNPRELFVIETIKAPIIERIETALHHTYALKRVSGEWFHFLVNEQSQAIRTATTLRLEAIESSSTIDLATKLQKKVSNGTVLEPDDDIRHAYGLIMLLRRIKSSSDQIEKTVKTTLSTATKSGVETSRFFTLQPKKDTESFDEQALRDAYPQLWAKYVTESRELVSRFELAKHSPDIATFTDERVDAIDELARSIEEIAAKARNNDDALASLHDGYLQMLTILGSVQWQIDLIEARIKAACGEAAEIRGVCKWARVEKPKEKFNKSGFKKENPEAYREFVTLKKSGPSSVIRRDRGFRI